MPAAVRIKATKYGSAIGLLLKRGGAFQTRHERTLIVNAAQKKALEQAGLIEAPIEANAEQGTWQEKTTARRGAGSRRNGS